MKILKRIMLLSILMCAGCGQSLFAPYKRSEGTTVVQTASKSYENVQNAVVYNVDGANNQIEVVNVPMFRENVIGLENLQTRTLVYCYDSPEASAQSCAVEFERRGFVRFKDIPRQTAEYDFLTDGTYPTRRWRNGEAVPRW